MTAALVVLAFEAGWLAHHVRHVLCMRRQRCEVCGKPLADWHGNLAATITAETVEDATGSVTLTQITHTACAAKVEP